MQKSKIFQIFYNELTYDLMDKGFLPLDNSKNSRPDWFEYWPIRNNINSVVVDGEDDVYYGFFSPKFYSKTGLKSSNVYNYINATGPGFDIISFSPYYDQAAFSVNIFEQADFVHKGISECFLEVFSHLGFSDYPKSSVMPANKIIFCNFFVAKKHVWSQWFDLCERLFFIAESGEGALFEKLNSYVPYSSNKVAAKVFVIERMISLLVFINKKWSVCAYDGLNLPFAKSRFSENIDELIILDALKSAYCDGMNPRYIEVFEKIRSKVISEIN